MQYIIELPSYEEDRIEKDAKAIVLFNLEEAMKRLSLKRKCEEMDDEGRKLKRRREQGEDRLIIIKEERRGKQGGGVLEELKEEGEGIGK